MSSGGNSPKCVIGPIAYLSVIQIEGKDACTHDPYRENSSQATMGGFPTTTSIEILLSFRNVLLLGIAKPAGALCCELVPTLEVRGARKRRIKRPS
jgi:hypothetical protein